ncbi:Spen-like protein [Macleaya cordata]|uniref:Spen-like protein n=1 Tax=Macleaya cordata TaxID=56857 RepID=A0A200Q2E4_MACCD|nr:Spen-like protein [Macleaya cordata]
MIGPPFGPQPTCMEHIKLPPPADVSDGEFLDESSRKRKAMSMDQQANTTSYGISQLVSDCWPRDLNSKHKVGANSAMQRNNLGLFSAKAPQFSERNIKGPQLGNQFHGLNSFSASAQFNEVNFPKAPNPIEKVNHSSNMQPQSLNPKGALLSINSPAAASPTLSDPLAHEYNAFSQIEACQFPSYQYPRNAFMENAVAGHGLNDGLNLGHKFNVFTGNSALQLHSSASENLGTLEASQLKHEIPQYVNLGAITQMQDPCKSVSSFEVKQSDQTSDVAGTRDTSSAGMSSSGTTACTGGKETDHPYHHSNTVERTNTSPSNNGVASNLNCKYQNYGDRDIQIAEETEGANMEDMKHSLGKEVSPKPADSPAKVLVENGHGDDSRRASHGLDGKSRSHAGKVAPTTTDKLWDGSLQLNASVRVSAVAFFKSGEKAPGINWPKSIEVKGKVRLEAFEKFIQELPRSRRRALMVISLCWKVGSSKTGLTCMKEVTKGYKEGERVGFAKLSPGIDIYVCPRSDTIIMILAKYGFFKGMAAVEDNQDSMIGCVVWQRNKKSLECSSKRGERKSPSLLEQPLNPQSDTAIQQNVEVNTALSQPCGGTSSPLGSETESAALESSGSKTIHSSDVQHEVGNSFTNVNSKLTPLVPDNSPAISMGRQITPHSDLNTLQSSKKSEVKVPLMCSSGLEKPDAPMEIPRAVHPVISQVVKPPKKPEPDDEDLPEFDFNMACGVSRNPVWKPLFSCSSVLVSDSVPLDKKLTAERTKNVIQPILSTLPIVQPLKTNYQERSEVPASQEFALDRNQGNPKQEHGNHDSIKLSSQSGTSIQLGGTAVLPRKNLWDDDDDDMPEWCPPDLEHRNHPPVMATFRPSFPCLKSPVHNPKPQNVRPVLPPPPAMPINPSLRPQRLTSGYQQCPITITMKPAQRGPVSGHVQFPPTASLAFNSDLNLRPLSSTKTFDVRPPIRPTGWRGWGP